MHIYYHKNYTSAEQEFDTTRKSAYIAESIGEDNLSSPDYFLAVSSFLIEKYHDANYIMAIRKGKNLDLAESNGFTWCPNIYTMAKYSTAGVIAAADAASVNRTIAGSLSSGIHHAKYDRGAGFCTVNSLALAAFNELKGDRNSRKRVLILDFDAHCGGGTVDMIRKNGFSNSVHQIDLSTSTYDEYEQDSNHKIYYCDGGDDDYLCEVEHILNNSGITPKNYSLVLYNAGTDPYPQISHSALEARDKMVFDYCAKNDIPCAFVLAGGYTDCQGMDSLVQSHVNTINAAQSAINSQVDIANKPKPTYEQIITDMSDINENALFADGLEDAIIGHTLLVQAGHHVVVYDAWKVIEILMRDNDMTFEEAEEYAEFNVFCAYMGEHTPLFVWDFAE